MSVEKGTRRRWEGGVHLPGTQEEPERRRWETHHRHSVGGQKLLGGHGRDVGYVGEDVDEGHQGNGDKNGSRQVPVEDRKS